MTIDYKKFTVVLPTLNESDTVGVLIRELLGMYKGISVVVVDDGSTDGTKDVVERISRKNGRVAFIDRAAKRRERGLTASAVDGILNSRTEFAIVMDADLQHPPEVVGRVALLLSKGFDIAVATRAEVKGWALHRKIISKSLIVFGYLVLYIEGAERCGDIFSGFFGVRKKFFGGVYSANRSRFVEGGYKILFDLLKCVRHGEYRVGDVPFSFGVRKHGASKAGFKQGAYLFRSFFS